MSLRSGLAAQFGFATESTYGTYVAPTRFIDFVSESISYEVDRVESKAIRANQRVMRSDDWAAGNKKVSGDVELELWNKSFGLIVGAMIGGNVSTAGTAAPYTHTYTPGDLPSSTMQFGIPDLGATPTVRPFTFLGAMVNEWELSANVGDPVKLKLGIVAQDLTTAQSLATASYASGVELLTFVGGSITVSGSSTCVQSITLKGNNGLDSERFCIGRTTTKEPLEAAMREYSGEFTAEFEDLTLFNLYRNGTEVAMVLTFAGVTNATHKLEVTCNVRFDGDTPTVGGPEIVKQPIKFKCVATGADSTAISMAYTTSDATP